MGAAAVVRSKEASGVTDLSSVVLFAVENEALALQLDGFVREADLGWTVMLARSADDAVAAIMTGGANLAVVALSPSATRSNLETMLDKLAIPVLRFEPVETRSPSSGEPLKLPFSSDAMRGALQRLGLMA
ncbi:hypothetical protein [Amorphus sp. 3PC139-8]|uniref:hypothetical protein n=1 Tax=Amorphus sp. 3PC139-8 TaxID=2735676 RepID=UPI00345CA103